MFSIIYGILCLCWLCFRTCWSMRRLGGLFWRGLIGIWLFIKMGVLSTIRSCKFLIKAEEPSWAKIRLQWWLPQGNKQKYKISSAMAQSQRTSNPDLWPCSGKNLKLNPSRSPNPLSANKIRLRKSAKKQWNHGLKPG